MTALITYGNKKYYKQQEELCKEAYGVFDKIFAYREWDIDHWFFEKNKTVLTQDKGNGYWLWKPFLILKTLMTLSEGDKLLYMDCGDIVVDWGVKDFIEKTDKDILPTRGGFRNGDWTKRDCFVYMECDTPEYHDSIQIEAGVIVLKRTRATIEIVCEWLDYCENPAILTDSPNTCGLTNSIGFKEHRHDQSILSNILIRRNITPSNEIRKYIQCNKR